MCGDCRRDLRNRVIVTCSGVQCYVLRLKWFRCDQKDRKTALCVATLYVHLYNIQSSKCLRNVYSRHHPRRSVLHLPMAEVQHCVGDMRNAQCSGWSRSKGASIKRPFLMATTFGAIGGPLQCTHINVLITFPTSYNQTMLAGTVVRGSCPQLQPRSTGCSRQPQSQQPCTSRPSSLCHPPSTTRSGQRCQAGSAEPWGPTSQTLC